MRPSTIVQFPVSIQAARTSSLMEAETLSRKMTCYIRTPSTGECYSLTSSGKKRSRCVKKRVSFDESVRVRRTMTLDEYTEEEVLAAWFGREEFDMIRRKAFMLVQKVERDGMKLGHDKKYCIRGLESLLSKRSELKFETKRKVTGAVLFEQEKQRLAKCANEQAIAAASSKLSAVSQILAISLGQDDRKEAHKVYKNNT